MPKRRQQPLEVPVAGDLFAFALDGARPLVNLSSGWQRRKRQLRAGYVPEFGEFDRLVLAEAKAACRRRQEMTGYAWAIDHRIPLARGGKHAWWNIQVIPASLNSWKGDSLILLELNDYAHHLPGGGGLPLPTPALS